MCAYIHVCNKNKEEVVYLKEEEGGTRRVGRREREMSGVIKMLLVYELLKKK